MGGSVKTIENVEFHFYRRTPKGYGRYDTSTGLVYFEGTGMTLEIPYSEDDSPYRIVGHPAPSGSYEGMHEGLPDDSESFARWARLGDRWVGTWEEEGELSLFTFTLPE